jgi:RPA family protein
MPEDNQRQRRAPARPKSIEDIDPQSDIRARIVGTVISLDDESITVDDGTGSAEVFMNEEEIEDIEENQSIRVLGRVLPTPDGFEIQAEAVHDLSDVDIETYNRVKKIVNTSE